MPNFIVDHNNTVSRPFPAIIKAVLKRPPKHQLVWSEMRIAVPVELGARKSAESGVFHYGGLLVSSFVPERK